MRTWYTDDSRKLALLLLSIVLILAALLRITTRPARADAGYALQFDGITHYVSLGDSGDLMDSHGWTAAKTISAWIKPTGTSAPAIPPTSGQMIVTADRPRTFGISRAVYQGADWLWIWNIDANGLTRSASTSYPANGCTSPSSTMARPSTPTAMGGSPAPRQAA